MDFRNWTYKRKNQVLALGVGVMLFLAWSLALSNTASLFFENTELKKQIRMAENAPAQIQKYKTELSKLDAALSQYSGSQPLTQQQLLALVTNFGQQQKLVLNQFPQASAQLENGYQIETQIIGVEGRFLNLLGLVYHLEQVGKAGKVASLYFEKKKDIRTRRTYLSATIYLQNLRRITDES